MLFVGVISGSRARQEIFSQTNTTAPLCPVDYLELWTISTHTHAISKTSSNNKEPFSSTENLNLGIGFYQNLNEGNKPKVKHNHYCRQLPFQDKGLDKDKRL